MKKVIFLILASSLLALFCIGCSSKDSDNPGEVATKFLNALQGQHYDEAKSYYAEDMDNMPNFRNKIESISPLVATELFDKLADFSYTIDHVQINANDKNKATITVSFDCYDLGNAFETTILDYLKTDLEMTYSGGKNEDIVKAAEDTIIKDIQNSQKNYTETAYLYLTKGNDGWKVDSLSTNTPILNILSGNLIYTIENLSDTLDNNK